MLVVTPSPKSQKQFVMTLVELSVNVTASGIGPEVGVAVNCATGASGPVQMPKWYDELPPAATNAPPT